MTNLFRKLIMKNNRGATIIIFTLILLIASTLIIIFAANQGKILQKITANQTRNSEAYAAAEAGLEFGINYLHDNSATILANPVSGYIPAYSDSSTTQSLANGSGFTITYSNPIANNYNIILISSTGTSADGSSSRTVSQQVTSSAIVTNPGQITLSSKGSVTLGGSSNIINQVYNSTIMSALAVTLGGSSSTTTSAGGSTPGNIGADITQNSAFLQNTSQDDFFALYFGTTDTSSVQANVAHYYSNSSSTNYSSVLDGMSGTSIWIDQTGGSTATINGSVIIGTTNNPVVIIVNGSLSLSGNVTINGFLFVLGTTGITTLTGSSVINGALITSDNLNITGNIILRYDSDVLENLSNQPGTTFYAKIAGTWKDF